MTTMAQALLQALEKKKDIKTGVPFLIVHHAEKVAKQEEKKEAKK